MEAKQIKAASVSRRTILIVSLVLCIVFALYFAVVLNIRNKPEEGLSSNIGENILRFDVFGPMGSLEPKPGEGGCANFVFYFIYSYLCIMNENGQLEPDLAAHWNYDKESFTWTIQIREGARFHDGSPVTSSDVIYSLMVPIEAYPSLYALIDRITALDERVIAIYLKEDDPAFLSKTWTTEIVKASRTADVNDASSRPIGSGPFKFEYRVGNQEVGLRANEDYYLGRPALDRVVLYFQPDKEKSWARLLAGATDLALAIEPQDYQSMKQYEDRFHFRIDVDHFLTALLYNANDSNLADPRVRMALTHAIDRQYIVSSLLNGMGVIPPGNLGHYCSLRNPELKPTPYNPAESIRLLYKAGWAHDHQGRYLEKDGKPFEFTILIFEENRIHESIARYVQLCFWDIGIKAHVRSVPFEELIRRYWNKAEFQAVITEYTDVRDGLNIVLDGWKVILGNSLGLSPIPQITEMARQIRREADDATRRALLDELDSLLNSLQPATPLVQKTSLVVLSKRFKLPSNISDVAYHFKLWKISPAR